MRFIYKLTILSCIFSILLFSLVAQNIDPTMPLPLDPNVVIGKLENGLTYYIRRNTEPANFVELRLAVSVGSVQENDDQLGLAHFTEHMAFNGTANFPNETLLDYLNSVGAGFGGGTNAYTSLEETVYITRSRTDNPEQLDTAFLILSDWAHRISFDHDEIDAERGIIVEELRGGRGVGERMWSQLRHLYFGDSQYAHRMPIGKQEIIENFEYQTIKDFYRDWYRPDLQAVIVVGDIDVQEIKALIEKHFGDIEMPKYPREKLVHTIPEHSETLFGVFADREMPSARVQVGYKHPAKKIETIADKRDELVESLLAIMMSNRFDEIVRQPNPPFLGAFAGKHNSVSTMDMFMMAATLDENKILEGYTALLVEIERAKRYGFYESELSRAIDEISVYYEQSYLERDKTQSRRLIRDIVSHFTRNTTLLGIENEYALAQILLPTITMQDIVNTLQNNITEENRIILVSMPENSEIVLPEEDVFISMFEQVKAMEIDKYPETVITEALLSQMPKKVKAGKPKRDKDLDVYTWTLKNGARVHLKTTDFKNNEIIFSARRQGGHSHAEDDVFNIANMMSIIIAEGGLGNFNKNQLDRYLAGKNVGVTTRIRRLMEEMDGSSSVADIETLMQLVYLYFTDPRYDETAYQVWHDRTSLSLRHMENVPNYVFQRTISHTLADDHFRAGLHPRDLHTFDYQKGFDFFRSRFDSANGFDFYFVGNITSKELQPLIERYLASLPNRKVDTSIIDRGMRMRKEPIRKEIYQGKEQKSDVRLSFTSEIPENEDIPEEQRLYQATIYILGEMLRENIREKDSSVYVIQAFGEFWGKPKHENALHIQFGCDPTRVDDIIEAVREQIEKLKSGDFDEKYLVTYKELVKNGIEIDIKTNAHWLSTLESYFTLGRSKKAVLNFAENRLNITNEDLIRCANKYFDLDVMIAVVMFPEE